MERLALVFTSMDASLARTDVSFGGTTEDDHGRRVPLDEFTAAATVFLSQVLGIDPVTTLPDHQGRPVYLLDDREQVSELL